MKKQLLTTILTVCLLWAVCASSALAADIKIMLNGRALSFEQAPYTNNGVTMVPMRAIFEALGADVDYDAASQKITAGRGDVTIELTLGQKTAKKNGASLTLDAAATAINGSTMVPLRFVAEALGADVNWDGAAQTVSITQETVNTGSSSTSSSNSDNKTENTAQTSAFDGANITFAQTTGEKLPYKTITDVENIPVTEEMYFDNYRIVSSEGKYEALDGFEWRIVDVVINYSSSHSELYGLLYSGGTVDYYRGFVDDDDFDIYYNGQGYDVEVVFTELTGSWNYEKGMGECVLEFAFQVPIGYDGQVVFLYDRKYYEDIYSKGGEKTIESLEKASAVCFRLK